jgi:CubicO group peptidase (beta-lactamase class C family)
MLARPFHSSRGAWLICALLAASCAGGADPDSGDSAGFAVNSAPSGLAERADRIMAPAFSPTPEDLSQCVGGVAVIVTPEGDLVQGWGASAPGGATQPGADTLFQVGSITKVFTGIALARLVTDHAFTLQTPVGDLLREDLRTARATWPTLGALITHSAGLPGFPDNLVDRDQDGRRDPGLDQRSPATGYGRKDLGAFLSTWRPASVRYTYSNVGVGLAGLALQDHLNLANPDEALRRLVTSDLGMTDTWGEVSVIPDADQARLAAGNVIEGESRRPGAPARMGVLASAGEIVTSASDMRIFLRALTGLEHTALDEAIVTASRPIAPGPNGRSIGYAIEIEERNGLTLYRKGGNTPSYAAHLIWSRRPAAGVAVLTNCGDFSEVGELARSLHEAALEP